MMRLKEWLGGAKQRLMTNIANRTFKKNPGLLDRLAIRFLRSSIGEVPHDPELDHPEN
jgi:hypothetical protein|tara:strand:+ start:501 stop:674 length:174 start_codon:yes stop_codon:yes gene_type:complete